MRTLVTQVSACPNGANHCLCLGRRSGLGNVQWHSNLSLLSFKVPMAKTAEQLLILKLKRSYTAFSSISRHRLHLHQTYWDKSSLLSTLISNRSLNLEESFCWTLQLEGLADCHRRQTSGKHPPGFNPVVESLICSYLSLS